MGRAYSALGGPLLTQCGDTSLFPQEPYLTIGGGWEQGVNLEPGVLATNQCPRSEPTVTQLTTKSATVTDAAGIGPFAGSIQFPGVAGQLDFAYVSATIGIIDPVLSIYVIMDDGGVPVVGPNSASVDLSLQINNAIQTVATVEPVFGVTGLYRASSKQPGQLTVTTPGIVRRTTQSGKGFRVVGYQIESGMGRTMPSRYKPTTGSIVTETNYYYPNSGIIQCARAVESTLANGLACSGSGVTWQVPPLLF